MHAKALNLCDVHKKLNEKCKFRETNCCLFHRRESAMSSMISRSRVMSQSKTKSLLPPYTTIYHRQAAFGITVTKYVM